MLFVLFDGVVLGDIFWFLVLFCLLIDVFNLFWVLGMLKIGFVVVFFVLYFVMIDEMVRRCLWLFEYLV